MPDTTFNGNIEVLLLSHSKGNCIHLRSAIHIQGS
jgi:hypothetical protein